MTAYTPIVNSFNTGLDEIGISLGLQRFDNESLYSYQKRLILETRERSGPSQYEFIRSLSRRVGLFDTPVFEIDLEYDSDGIPLAEDPWINITSSHLYLYNNKVDNEIDVEIDFTDKTDGYFLADVYTAISASTYFSIKVLDEEYEEKLSKYLRYGNNEMHILSEILYPKIQNKLANKNLVKFYPDAQGVFINEVASIGDIAALGDYYIDYANSVLFSYENQGGFVSYTYRQFPYILYHQAVHAYPYNDIDKKYLLNTSIIDDDTGLESYISLNGLGARLANDIIGLHPLTWGY